MNIRDIKLKAKSVLVNRNNIVGVFVFIGIISTVATFIGSQFESVIPFLSLIIMILMLPFSHGNVVTALKAVNERGDEITIEKDGVVGIRRFKELFSTYFIREVLLMVILILIGLVIFLVAKFTVSSDALSKLVYLIQQTVANSTNVDSYLNNPQIIDAVATISVIFLIGVIIIVVVATVYSFMFALTPFVLEKYNLKGAKAMSESARLMKGRKGTLFTLYLSYLGWYILTLVLAGVLNMVVPIPLILDVAVAALSAYLYGAELNTSVAVFFEEVDLEDKNKI